MKKPSIKSKYEELRRDIRDYYQAMGAVRRRQHSNTPAIAVKGDVKGLATIQVNELITIVKTAKVMRQTVELDATTDSLILSLVDNPPQCPRSFYNIFAEDANLN